MSAPDPIKRAWKAYGGESVVPRLEDVQASSRKFDRHIRIRNGVEYAACLFVIIIFSYAVTQEPAPLLKLAHGLIVLATCFVAWQLYRRGSVPEVPAAASLTELIDHHRRHMARQRDALKNIWWWYLLPFVPGQLLFFVAQPPVPGKEWVKILSGLFILLVFGGIGWLNQIAAANLQKAIDELDTLEGVGE